MKISILSPDLSGNCLGRAYLLAKILKRRYDVEVAGPVTGSGIWAPVAGDKSVTYVTDGKISGDVIYASKPLCASFGKGLLLKITGKRPLVLDIDDWELASIKEGYKRFFREKRLLRLLEAAILPNRRDSYLPARIMQGLIPGADGITVSGRTLQKMFGGRIVWHARDTRAFDPARFDGKALRQKYGLNDDEKIILFFGTPRPWKGIEDLITAVKMAGGKKTRLVAVGLGADRYSGDIARKGKAELGSSFLWFGIQPFEAVPEFLSMSDVVVIPQRADAATMAQVPAKVFDAMAMAKPIIATGVSDLPEILEGCGWIVPPANREKLARTIKDVLENQGEAEAVGKKARKECERSYSWDAAEKELAGVFEKYN